MSTITDIKKRMSTITDIKKRMSTITDIKKRMLYICFLSECVEIKPNYYRTALEIHFIPTSRQNTDI
jgi:hypothetical protein